MVMLFVVVMLLMVVMLVRVLVRVVSVVLVRTKFTMRGESRRATGVGRLHDRGDDAQAEHDGLGVHLADGKVSVVFLVGFACDCFLIAELKANRKVKEREVAEDTAVCKDIVAEGV
ncbi:hypothetical protein DD237_005433 [Peronospora effusa]|uniref:Uncharacterized protein n=1 Tax=Peronospora effusa TaxID=542832 RepID=A0A3R7WKC3_9STRA|nr:hypothetical protein DD237_005433 [Peronospora effusa]